MRIIVVGNCQAEPLSCIISLITGLDAIPPIVAHLQTAKTRVASKERLAAADLILAQPILPSYRVKYVATDNIRAKHPSTPIVTFPNLFFTGQQLGYVNLYASAAEGRTTPVVGNFGIGHLMPILRAWDAGVPQAEVGHRLGEFEEDEDALNALAARSLHELKQREAMTDVTISDYIEDHWRERRLFYTFNHPVSELMIELARRIVERAGLPHEWTVTPDVVGEPLSILFPPSLPFSEGFWKQMTYPRNPFAYGPSPALSDGRIRMNGAAARHKTIDALISEAYWLYDHQRDALRNVVMTPAGMYRRQLRRPAAA